VITLCIVAASILWFAFSMQETYTRIIELPTEVVNLPANQALTARPPDEVRIQVEGEGIQLLRLYYNRPKVRIDASAESVDLEMAANDLAGNVNLTTVTPRSVILEKESRINRRIPVEHRLDISYEPGHRVIGEFRLMPDSVVVSGAESIVNGLRAWPTVARRLSGVQDSIDQDLALSDTLAGLVAIDTRRIRLFAEVQEFTEGRRMLDIEVTDLPAGRDYSLDPPRVQVVYQVPLSQFDRVLASEEFRAYVPYEQIRDDVSGLVYPSLNIPPGLEIQEVRMSPTSVRYYDVVEGN